MLTYAFESVWLAQIVFVVSLLVFLGFFGLLLQKLWTEEKAALKPLAAILIIAVLLRVVWIDWTQPEPRSDFGVYWDYAHRFYQGNLAFDVIERHPGIILLYWVGFALLGPSLLTGWIVNVVFSLLFLLVLYKLSQELFGRQAALLATALGALLPQLITYSALMASEVPAVTFFLLIIWAALQTRHFQSQRIPYWIGLGALFYGAVLIRSTSLLLLGLIPLSILLARRHQWKQGLIGCLVMIASASVLLSTWVGHQYMITGQPKLLYGEELWLVYATQYDKGGSVSEGPMPFQEKFDAMRDGTIQGKLRGYRMLRDEALKIIQADPIRYLRFGFVRMRQILWGSKSGVQWSTQASSVFPQDPKLIRRLSEISTHPWRVFLMLAPLGLLALWRPISPLAREGQVLIWIFLVFWLLFHYLIAVASERYAFQIIPFVVMLASAGIIWVFKLAKHRLTAKNADQIPA